MKHKFLLFVTLAFLCAPLLQAQQNESGRFSFKFGGGLNYLMNGGDLKEWFGSESKYYSSLDGKQNYDAKADYKFSHAAPDLFFEVLFDFKERFSLGLGLGYTVKSWKPSSEIKYTYGADLGSDSETMSRTERAQVVPLVFSARYLLLDKEPRLSVLAGLGYYLGCFKFSNEVVYVWPKAPEMENYTYRATEDLEAKQGRIGFLGGIGLEKRISSKILLVLELFWQRIKFSDIKGDIHWKETASWANTGKETSGTRENQTLWYGNCAWEGITYQRAVFDSTKPEWLENARSFEFGFNGFVLRASLKIEIGFLKKK